MIVESTKHTSEPGSGYLGTVDFSDFHLKIILACLYFFKKRNMLYSKHKWGFLAIRQRFIKNSQAK